MENIVTNEYYEMSVEPSKNRIYLKLIGFWKSPEQVSNYVLDLQTAVGKLRPGFTVLVDLRSMKPPSTSIVSFHLEAQKFLVEKGLSCTANVTGNAPLLELQLNKYANEFAMTKAEFDTLEAGEEWLDSK